MGSTRIALLAGAVLALGVPLVIAPDASAAKSLKVCPSGCSYTTIQAAIDAAPNGGSIVIGAGTYEESLTVSKTLTLTGAGVGQTVTRAVEVTETGVATLKSLRISDPASVGIGVGIANFGTLTLVASSVTGSRLSGIYNAGTATIKDTTISSNESLRVVYDSCVPNRPCLFGGAGIFNDGVLTLTNSTVSDNRSRGTAGGILSTGNLTMSGSTVTRNAASGGCFGGELCVPSGAASGAGLAVVGGTATVNDSTISDNTARDYGGGIYVSSATVTITGTTVADNSAGLDGGGISNYGTTTLKRSSITGNTAVGSGGGIENSDGGDIQLRGTTMAGNSALQGGGLVSTSIAPVPVWMDSKTAITDNVPDNCWPISFGAGCAA